MSPLQGFLPPPDKGAQARKTRATIEVLRAMLDHLPRRVLVVGCGSGFEAGLLARSFDAEAVGIDLQLNFEFDHAGSSPACLLNMDATALTFPDDAFDLVYSFHALEHIERPAEALREMSRVLAPNGSFLIGTPNKSRLIGYMGAPDPLLKKIQYNIEDVISRVSGKWNNASGAHAGFTAPELVGLCRDAFGAAQSVGTEYYKQLYTRHVGLIDRIVSISFDRALFPCVYVAGRKPAL